jgi:hypothetical protein
VSVSFVCCGRQNRMPETIPYWLRIVLLLLVMSVVAGIDWHRHRRNATRWREYGFVILSGIIGTVFGFCNDLLTSSISPEYFIFGKGLATGEGLMARAGILGMKAGFAAGAVAGAICLYASTRKCSYPPLAYRNLLRLVWRPVVLAATAAFIAVLFRQHDPLAFSAELEGILPPEQVRRFLVVWWIHAGLYSGLLVAVFWIIVDIIRLRKRQATTVPQRSEEPC